MYTTVFTVPFSEPTTVIVPYDCAPKVEPVTSVTNAPPLPFAATMPDGLFTL